MSFMKKTISIAFCLLCFTLSFAQTKKTAATRENDNALPDIYSSIIATQEQMPLFVQNSGNNTKEHDVNTIILDIEKYIDSLRGTRSRADVLLNKYFAPLRLYYLTTSNKTSVATMFLYSEVPYTFCRYSDSGLALHIGAIKNGNIYNLGKITERKAAKTAMETCLLPALKALDEFKEGELKYAAISIYYGCKDTREGAATEPLAPYCMTLLAKLTEIQQYNAGLITAKGLLANAEVYLSDGADAHDLRKTAITVE